MEKYIPSAESVEYLDHTADIWVQATGDGLQEVICRLIHGIYGVIASTFDIERSEDGFVLEVKGPDRESAMVELLNEILYLFDVESRILIDNNISIHEENGSVNILLKGKGCSVSIPEGEGGMEVKAVTYHGVTLKDDVKEQVRGRVLLDL